MAAPLASSLEERLSPRVLRGKHGSGAPKAKAKSLSPVPSRPSPLRRGSGADISPVTRRRMRQRLSNVSQQRDLLAEVSSVGPMGPVLASTGPLQAVARDRSPAARLEMFQPVDVWGVPPPRLQRTCPPASASKLKENVAPNSERGPSEKDCEFPWFADGHFGEGDTAGDDEIACFIAFLRSGRKVEHMIYAVPHHEKAPSLLRIDPYHLSVVARVRVNEIEVESGNVMEAINEMSKRTESAAAFTGREHVAFSAGGVEHYSKGGELTQQSFYEWTADREAFYAAREKKIYKYYPIWKYMRAWRKAASHMRIQRLAHSVSKGLVLLNPSSRSALVELSCTLRAFISDCDFSSSPGRIYGLQDFVAEQEAKISGLCLRLRGIYTGAAELLCKMAVARLTEMGLYAPNADWNKISVPVLGNALTADTSSSIEDGGLSNSFVKENVHQLLESAEQAISALGVEER
jgi:hypothetical protein